MKRSTISVLGALSVVALVTGCTSPGEKTKIGAGTGGAIGAGLGAIVGSQVGGGGAGLVLGGTAGAGAGGLIGNSLDQQDRAMRNQNEAIERQKRLISAQKTEIDDLRRMSRDQVSYRSDSFDGGPGGGMEPRVPGEQPELSGNSLTGSSLKERNLGDVQRGSLGWERSSDRTASLDRPIEREIPVIARGGSRGIEQGVGPVEGLQVPYEAAAISSRQMAAKTPECSEAEDEARRAEKSLESADKLFHFRRALRLCPGEGRFHAGIAGVYTELNRSSDAAFELREALKYDSSNPEYREKLASVER